MFDDDYNGDEENESQQDDTFDIYKKQIEKEFFMSLKKGEDLTIYLYLPHIFVTPKIKEHLDIFLIKEAYKNLFESDNEIPIVYKDPYYTAVLKDNDFKKKTLIRMLDYYTDLEEYEKCVNIKRELDKLNH